MQWARAHFYIESTPAEAQIAGWGGGGQKDFGLQIVAVEDQKVYGYCYDGIFLGLPRGCLYIAFTHVVLTIVHAH